VNKIEQTARMIKDASFFSSLDRDSTQKQLLYHQSSMLKKGRKAMIRQSLEDTITNRISNQLMVSTVLKRDSALDSRPPSTSSKTLKKDVLDATTMDYGSYNFLPDQH